MNPRLMTAALALTTMMMMTPLAADAAPYWPWCSRYYGTHGGGLVVCTYATWEQCMDTQRGIGGICYRNPNPNPQTPVPGRPAKSHRHAAS
jgi:Protein of unknown function (DUF3551)